MDNLNRNLSQAREAAKADLQKAETDDKFVRENFALMKLKLSKSGYPEHELEVARKVVSRGRGLGLS